MKQKASFQDRIAKIGAKGSHSAILTAKNELYLLPLLTLVVSSVQDFQLTENSVITKSLTSEHQEEAILETDLSTRASNPVDIEGVHMVACGPTYFVGLLSAPLPPKKPSRSSSLGEQGMEAVKLKATLRAEIGKRKELEEKIVTL